MLIDKNLIVLGNQNDVNKARPVIIDNENKLNPNESPSIIYKDISN
jgi:hypothetical protein